MSIEGQGHSFTIYFPGFVCFVLYLDKISGERLQDYWSSGVLIISHFGFNDRVLLLAVPVPGIEVIKLFSCYTQLSTKIILLINAKMPTLLAF